MPDEAALWCSLVEEAEDLGRLREGAEGPTAPGEFLDPEGQ